MIDFTRPHVGAKTVANPVGEASLCMLSPSVRTLVYPPLTSRSDVYFMRHAVAVPLPPLYRGSFGLHPMSPAAAMATSPARTVDGWPTGPAALAAHPMPATRQ